MRIAARFNGPPNSAHGGTAVGHFAATFARQPVEVRLIGPPPLETDLESRTEDDGSVFVYGPAGDVARVRPLDRPVEVGSFDLVTEEDLDAASADYLRGVAERGHPFPTCFGCGPQRDVGDGLRQFAGAVPGQDTVAARMRCDGEGRLSDWMVWAGLDCPSAGAIGAALEDPPPAMVLGTMSGQVERDAYAGVDYQVRARLLGSQGRKHITEVALLAPDGSRIGAAQAVWITIDLQAG